MEVVFYDETTKKVKLSKDKDWVYITIEDFRDKTEYQAALDKDTLKDFIGQLLHLQSKLNK